MLDEPAERITPAEAAPHEDLGIPRAVGRGFLIVGSSPVLVVLPLLFPLAIWLALVLIGLQDAPTSLVDAFAVPPLSMGFDINEAQKIFATTPASMAVLVGLFVVRGLVVGPVVGMIFDVLEGARPSTYGALRGLRALPTILAVDIVIVGVTSVAGIVLSFLGPGLSTLGVVALPVAGLWLLAFAPMSAVREGRGVQASLTRSLRAARLRMPGGSHFVMCLAYYVLSTFVLLIVASRLPGGADATANPSIGIWAVVLVSTFIHTVFLAAFCARWLAIESDVPDEPVRRRPQERAHSSRQRGR